MSVLNITYVRKGGPFLQFYGHQNSQLLEKLLTNLNAYLPYLQQQQASVPASQLNIKTIYLVQTNQYRYHRCILNEPKRIKNNFVSVELIDYGIEIDVSAENIIPLDPRTSQASFLLTFAPIATLYFLSSFCCNWNHNEIDIIRQLINEKVAIITNVHQVDSFKLVSLSVNNEDVQTSLIAKGIGSFVNLSQQVSSLMAIVQPNSNNLPEEYPSMPNKLPKMHPGRNLVPSRPLQPPNVITNRGKQLIVNHLVPNTQRIRSDNASMPAYGHTAIEGNHGGSGDSNEKRLSGPVPVFIANDLSIGSRYTVFCSYVQNGPQLFSIQLKSQEQDLDRLMNTLSNIPLQNLRRKPQFGMACVARYSEDKNFYRAAMLTIQPTVCRVTYVDYGNSEDVSTSDIFEIPESLLEPKVFAMQFTLAGCRQLEPVDDRIKEYFSNLVHDTELELRVMPLEGAGFVQNCELYYKNRSILDLLRERQMQNNMYVNPKQLEDSDNTIIRYVKSAQNFFVQRVADIPRFEAMMDKLFIHCKSTCCLVKAPKAGFCCAAMSGNDENEWYRVKILHVHDNNKFTVEFVDYGNVDQCTLNQLKSITSEFLKLPRQAIECCLVDFEHLSEVPSSAAKQLEMLAEDESHGRKKFRVVLHSRADAIYIVNLYDDSQSPVLNVSATLYKHSMPRKPYGGGKFSNKTTQNPECMNSTAISDNNNSKSWSEIDRMSHSVSTTDDNTRLSSNNSNKTSNWESSSRSSEYQTSSGRTSSSRDTDDTRKKSVERADEQNSRDKNNRFSENTDNNFRNARSTKSSSNWSDNSSNERDAQSRKARDSDQEWRSDDQNSNNFIRKPDRRPNEFNYKRERPILQKHLIPRFNRQNRPSSGNSLCNENFSKNQNQNHLSEISASDSSGFYSKADSSGKSTNSDSRSSNDLEEIVPFGTKLPEPLIPLGSSTRVNILVWISPHEFYVQLNSCRGDCDEMMEKIQLFYKNRESTKNRPNIGDIIIVRHRKDNLYKRAKILDYNSSLDKYRVQFIDLGTKTTCQIGDIYELEKSFTRLVPTAVWCSFHQVMKNLTRDEIEAKIDHYFKGNQTIPCTFLSTVGDITYVDLDIDGQDLKQSLINDGLISSLPSDCNLKRLVGQVIAVKTTEIRDLSCFWTKIFGLETKLMCCYKDMKTVKQNPNLSVEFKRSHENDYFTVKVDGVTTDNVLILSIYLPFLTDESGPEIPAYPIFLDSFDCQVIHIETMCEVYVQNAANSQYMTNILNEMFDFYDKGGDVLSNQLPGEICAALSEDGNYYRGRIEEINDDNTVKIHYIDYGNWEIVPNTNIKVLDSKFKNTSALAERVFLPVKRAQNVNSDEVAIDRLKALVNGFLLQFKIMDVHQSYIIASIENHGFRLIDVLRQACLMEEISLDELKTKIDELMKKEKATKVNRNLKKRERQPETKSQNETNHQDYNNNSKEQQTNLNQAQIQNTRLQEVPSEQILQQQTETQSDQLLQDIQVQQVQPSASNTTETTPLDAKIPNTKLAYISHVDRPDSFYLQLHSTSDELNNFQQNLQLIGSSLAPLTDFRTGVECVAKYSVDDQWYRAKIIDTDGQITSIRFTDYGNTDTITDINLLKCDFSNNQNIQGFAVHCSLPIQPRNNREWSDEACKKILELSNNQVLQMESICESSPDKMFVKLFYDSRDITKELIIEGYADPLEIVKSGEKCYVSHVNSLSDFYIQMDSDSKALQLIEEYFADVSKFGEMKEFKKGTICIAEYEDGKYYRVRVLDDAMTENGLKVFFIDYGNTFMAKNIRALPENIAELQQLLKKCTMKLPNGVKEWSEEAEKRFVEKALGDSIFIVQLVQPGRKAIVELFIDDCDIGDELAQFCEIGVPVTSIIDEHEVAQEIQTPQPTSILSTVNDREPAYISHLNSLNDFYVQLKSKTEDLNVMSANLVAACDQPSLNADQVKEGDICAAKFSYDDLYYRAKILRKSVIGYDVLFIDYGNESCSSDLRTLPSVLKNAKTLAIHCKLSPNESTWTEQDNEYFRQITNPTDTFQIEIIDCNKMPCVINLFKDDQNLRDSVLKNHFDASKSSSNDCNQQKTD